MLKRYEEYKKIDLPWLKEVPVHWNILRNKNIFFEQKCLVGNNKSKYTLLSLTKKGIIQRDLVSGKGKFPKDFDTYKVVDVGDMVFCFFDVDETPRTVGLSTYKGMITGAYNVFKVKNICSEYVYYYNLAFDNTKAYKPLYSGLRKVIPLQAFMSTIMPVPPRPEQDKIVQYLDWKTSEMSRFIHQKKKQIGLLKELRKKKIDEITIKGINPNALMKYSGMDWLGDIPENWGMTKIRNEYSLQNGISESGAFFDKGTPFVNYSDVYNNRILPTEVKDVANSNDVQQRIFSVKKGDIFFTRTSETIDEIGMASICLKDIPCAVFSGFLIRARSKKNNLYLKYVGLYLQTQKVRNYFTKEMNLVIRASLGQNLLKSLYIPVPPYEEQIEIVEYLEKRLAEIDEMISSIQKEISLVEELKVKLVSDVVTGQVDVRDIKIPTYETETDNIESDDGSNEQIFDESIEE